jgi:hypothetical protein
MLRFLATIATILWLVVGAVALVSLAPLPSEHRVYHHTEPNERGQCNEEGAPSLIRTVFCWVGGFVDSFHDDISAVATVFIAAFTIILALFTFSLAKSTRRAADAAKEAASVIPILERAFVYVDKIAPTIGEPAWRSEKVGSSKTVEHSRPSSVKIAFVNYGRTPANVVSAVAFADFLDHIPNADDERKAASNPAVTAVPIMAIIGSDKTWDGVVMETNTRLNSTTLQMFRDSNIHLYCWGIIQYRDIFGDVHPTYFCRRVIYRHADRTFSDDPVGGFDRNRSE